MFKLYLFTHLLAYSIPICIHNLRKKSLNDLTYNTLNGTV